MKAVMTVIPPEIIECRKNCGAEQFDEVWEGVLHMSGSSRPIRAGSCIYLPPLHVHSLENTGSAHMRVLGVFQPAGSPAARYGES